MPKNANKITALLLLALLPAGSMCASAQSAAKSSAPSKTQAKPKPRVQVEDDDAKDSVDPKVREAEAALRAKEFEKARTILEPYVSRHTADYIAWYDLSYVYIGLSDQPKTLDALKKTLELKPDLFEANLNLASLYIAAGQRETALTYLRQATKSKPAVEGTDGPYRAWMLLGHLLVEKQPAESLDAARHAIELRPKELDPHLLAAEDATDMKDWPLAESEFKAALQIDPKSSEAQAGLVQVYVVTKREAEAEKSLRAYVELEPKNSAARVQLGRLLARQGKNEEALSHLEAVRQAVPTDRDIVLDVVALNDQLGHFDKNVEILKPAVEAAPRNAALLAALGHAQMKMKQYAPSEESLISALRVNENQSGASDDLAIVANELKHYKLAIAALDNRAKALPENTGTWFLRATCYDHLGMYKEASASYRRFIAVAGDKFPNQVWQAEHRLIAIDPTYDKKKK